MRYYTHLFLYLCSAILLVSCATEAPETDRDSRASDRPIRPIDLVDPFIGTGGHGHTFPGATAPFGMVQLSPDTRLEGWDGCGGYHYTDSIVYGFSHTHLSGTGVSDYGDILLKPCMGPIILDNGYTTAPDKGYASYFDKSSEYASPGYYAVRLQEGIDVELTATTRTGMHRYTWPEGERAHVVLDLAHRDQLLDATITYEDPVTISGHRSSNAWANDQRVYFWMTFSEPYHVNERDQLQLDLANGDRRYVDGKVALRFDPPENGPLSLTVSVGISSVSVEGARKNYHAEAAGASFDSIVAQTEAMWTAELDKILVDGQSVDDKEIFYTALYHTMIAPNTYSDVDGRYRQTIPKALNGQEYHRIGQVEEGQRQYTVFSLWDTYRATHPLYTLTQQERTGEFIRTFLRQYEDGGQLPVWELASTYTGCMIGYHSVPVIADAYAKGITDFDAHLALTAMRASAEAEHLGLDDYVAKGFMATGDESESVSKTLEYAYDDWCIADFADRLGEQQVADRYYRRAQHYKNLYNPSTAFLQGRTNGGWYGPFRPEEVNFNYTEANGWQYSLAVPQDVNGLIDLMGGDEAFIGHLDRMFAAESETSGREQVDITGLIGQYAHGNEPSHHMAYLYSYAGRPWRTQEIVEEIMSTLYTTSPDGLSGNEDCGQMSAWYVMSALGIYPVCPGSTQYVLGTPRFEEARLSLENGRDFTFRALDLDKGPYIQSISLNGRPYSKSWIDHADIMAGGEVAFQMSAKPEPTFGIAPADRPVQRIAADGFIVTPAISTETRTFSDSLLVTIDSPQSEAVIVYTTDGTDPGTSAGQRNYAAPFYLSRSAEVKAIAILGEESSPTISAEYFKVDGSRSIALDCSYANQYSAGGDGALIDMIRGSEEFTTGDWQGYREDLDVTIDLGKVMPVSRISLGANQNIKSWIWFPKEVTFYIGDTPERLAPLPAIVNRFPDDRYGAHVMQFEREFQHTSARYIRVTARQYGECPPWHLGAGGKTWMFFDEISIE